MAAAFFPGEHREREQHRKPAAFSLFALHVDAAVHAVHDGLRDGHAQTRALDAAHRGRALPLEGFEDPGYEFLAHADAGVRDRQLVIRQVVPASGLLQGDGDRAPFRRKFIGVAHQIEQNAVEPVGVAQHPAVLDGVTVHRKGHVLLAHLFGKHVPDTVQHIAQIGLRRLQLHVPGLDAAHLQHVVDEGQQMVAGGADLLQIAVHVFGAGVFPQAQLRVADDGVERRAQVVGHVGEELALRRIGLPGFQQGFLAVHHFFDNKIEHH